MSRTRPSGSHNFRRSRKRNAVARPDLKPLDTRLDLDDAIVSLCALDRRRRFAIGIANGAAVARRVAVLRSAGLRVAGVDYDGFALGRTFSNADAVLDIGYGGARLYAFGGPVPFGAAIDYGGQSFTDAIARAFAIGGTDAEQRKRTAGSAGIDDVLAAGLCRAIGRAVRSSRAAGCAELRSLVLCGNGARLPGLADAVAAELRCRAELASELTLPSVHYPCDVVGANATDWALAVGLALYGVRPVRAA